jgi:hypothetical protein
VLGVLDSSKSGLSHIPSMAARIPADHVHTTHFSKKKKGAHHSDYASCDTATFIDFDTNSAALCRHFQASGVIDPSLAAQVHRWIKTDRWTRALPFLTKAYAATHQSQKARPCPE